MFALGAMIDFKNILIKLVALNISNALRHENLAVIYSINWLIVFKNILNCVIIIMNKNIRKTEFDHLIIKVDRE